MRVLVDVDGVLADLVGELCHRLRGVGLLAAPEDVRHYDFSKVWPQTHLALVYEWMASPGFANELQWYAGAPEFLAGLPGDIVALTHPYHRSQTWAYDRTQWLRGHVHHIVLTASKHLVGGDVLVEDHLDNLNSWLEAHPQGRGVLIDRPWNRDKEAFGRRTFRCRSYADAGRLIAAMAK
jgi:5'(3')-deoxyribonucleotidase